MILHLTTRLNFTIARKLYCTWMGGETKRTFTSSWWAGTDRESGIIKIYFGWTEGYNYRQDWLIVFTLQPPWKVPRFGEGGNSSSVPRNATWSDCTSDTEVPCWACRRRCQTAGHIWKHITDACHCLGNKDATISNSWWKTAPVLWANVLTKQGIEKFASLAHAYICTYHHLYQEQKRAAAEHEDSNSFSNADSTSPVAGIPSHKQQELLYSAIERLSKAFKGHRCNAKIGEKWLSIRYAKGSRIIWRNSTLGFCMERIKYTGLSYARRVDRETWHTKYTRICITQHDNSIEQK